MKQIYACKLYKASNRKQKIQSALANPINQPLVKQLREYLDDEYIRKDILEPESIQENEERVPEEEPSGGDNLEGEGTSTPIVPKTSEQDSELSDSVDDNQDELETQDGEEDESVKSSIQASLQSISVIDIDSLKGLMNSVDNTSGIIRVKHDNEKHELWLYYNDSVNLNDVMTPVIELLEASNYYYLTFSRLARSANAMVFEVGLDCTVQSSISGTIDNGGTKDE